MTLKILMIYMLVAAGAATAIKLLIQRPDASPPPVPASKAPLIVAQQAPASEPLKAAGPKVPNAVASGSRTPHPPPHPGEIQDMAIKELGNFDYAPELGEGIPDDVLRLNGIHIRLHGYMIPLDQAENITRFALVPSLFNCCFGQPPGVQHTVLVECSAGNPYTSDTITVEGTLAVHETKQDGYVISLFSVSSAKVNPSTP
jgi:hypothetical protein